MARRTSEEVRTHRAEASRAESAARAASAAARVAPVVQGAQAVREVRQAIPGPPKIGGGAGNVLLIAGIAFVGYLFVTGRLKGVTASIFGPSPFLAPSAAAKAELTPEEGGIGPAKVMRDPRTGKYYTEQQSTLGPGYTIRTPRGTPGINPAAPDPYTADPRNIPPRWGKYRR